MLKKSVVAALAATLILAGGTACAAGAARTIDVTGVGTVLAVPDMASIDTGVVTRADTASAALAANNKAMTQVLQRLAAAGIASKDIQTRGFSVQPQYKYDRQNQLPPTIIGYSVSNQVNVTVRKLSSLGRVLDALVKAGSNQVSGIAFRIAAPATLMNEARRKAVADAKAHAELYASSAGIKLGQVLSIVEGTGPAPRPGSYMVMKGTVADSVPVATGESELSATVRMAFEIE